MKRLSTICMAALLLAAVSCKKNAETVETPEPRFFATTESHTGDSKTSLEGLAVKWTDGDAIMVYNANGATHAFETDGVSSQSGFAGFWATEGGVSEEFYTPDYTAVFPSRITYLNPPAPYNNYKVILLPQVQLYAENSFGQNANPMVAYSDNEQFQFVNLCGVLRLDLYGASEGMSVSEITVRSNLTNDYLYGAAGIIGTPEAPELLMPGLYSGNSLRLNCDGDGAPLSADAEHPTPFYFVIPDGRLSGGFTVDVSLTDGHTFQMSTTHDCTIHRNKIRRMAKVMVDPEPFTVKVNTLDDYCRDCELTFKGMVTVKEGHPMCECGFVLAKTSVLGSNELEIGNAGCEKHEIGTLQAFPSGREFETDYMTFELEQDVRYSIRAYSILEGQAYYGKVLQFVYSVPEDIPSSWVDGVIPSEFSVGPSKKVHFSQGNLQYIGSAATPYWQFAEHQFDFLNWENRFHSEDRDRDLFGWGCSGVNPNPDPEHPVDPYYLNYQPWHMHGYEMDNDDPNPYYMGPTYYEGGTENDLSVEKGSDWGCHAIRNGGNVENSGWRLLTQDEMNYLFKTRANASQLLGWAYLGECKMGLVLLPDNWTGCPDGLTFISGDVMDGPLRDEDGNLITQKNIVETRYIYRIKNSYTYREWSKMEAAGAVFIPYAGSELVTSWCYCNFMNTACANYWASTVGNYEHGCSFSLQVKQNVATETFEYALLPAVLTPRHWSCCVRLVKDAN